MLEVIVGVIVEVVGVVVIVYWGFFCIGIRLRDGII